ncbi:MAG: hypothetical protein U0R19_18410 [Bryobacteraceae bacterium]
MSITESNLAPTGYDCVVAVTQDSINDLLMQYLYPGLPETVLCYVYDSNNNAVAVDYGQFQAQVNGTDPFSIPAGTAMTDARVQALNAANFAFAIQAKLGIPSDVPPSKLPPIVSLQPGQSSVQYALTFSEFEAAALPREQNQVTWFYQSQGDATCWSFSGPVSLNLQAASFSSLPAAVQAQLQGMGNPNQFSVQQLYLDLNSSALEQGFQFQNLPQDSALNTFMANDFVGTYWKALGGGEVLGYGAQQTSGVTGTGLAVTDLNFYVPPAVGSEGAPLTLNYLCATNNDALPGTGNANFGWNWIEPNETGQYNGVVALNRNTFAGYLSKALAGYVSTNCYLPKVQVKLKGAIPEYSWSMTAGQMPTISLADNGGTFLTILYEPTESEDQAGLHGDLGQMKLGTSYSLTVSASGTQMTIVQHLTVYCYIRHLATSASGNVVDIVITDTYSFGVNEQGGLVISASSAPPVNTSKVPKANGFLNFWAPVNSLASDVETWAKSIAATNLQDIPAAAMQSFVFPGGATFSFADVAFSDSQDLVSHIVYLGVGR